MSLPESTKISFVHLRVRELAKATAFYSGLLGFREVLRDGATIGLSDSGRLPAQIILTESKNAPARPPRTVGLFHVAIRFPTREELAMILLRILEREYPLHGAADHAVSEAVYLADPEGNGIELYRDRVREEWKRTSDEIYMTSDHLDIENLLGEAEGKKWTGLPTRTDIGHVHLNVSSLQHADEFYSGLVGLDVTTRSYPGALFLAADGYHHHVGANVWSSRNGEKPPPNSLGLVSFGMFVSPVEADHLRKKLTQEGAHIEENSLLGQHSFRTHDRDGIAVEFMLREN